MNRHRKDRRWSSFLPHTVAIPVLLWASLLGSFPHGHAGFSAPAPAVAAAGDPGFLLNPLRVQEPLDHSIDLCSLCVLGQHLAGTASDHPGSQISLEKEGNYSLAGAYIPSLTTPTDLEPRAPPIS